MSESHTKERPGDLAVKIDDAGRKSSGIKEKMDCTVRATAIALGIPYAEAHAKLAALGRKPGQGFEFRKAVDALGLERRVDLCATTLARVLPELAKGRFIVKRPGHVFAVIDGEIHDTGHKRPGMAVQMVYEVKGTP